MDESTVHAGNLTRRMIVGVDGSPGAQAALAWAITEARCRGVPLDVLIAWQYPAPWAEGFNARWADDESALEERARQTADDSIANAIGSGSRPHGLRVVVVNGTAATMLVGHSRRAGLLVLGRGRRGLARGVLGSTTRTCLHNAGCPVVVVPATCVDGEGG